MSSKPTFLQVSGPKKRSGRAISLCLYSSPKFDQQKHMVPLLEFIGSRDEAEADLLIFCQADMCGRLALPGVRVFSCGPSEGFKSNLWRYYGASQGYRWTWFRGADTPRVPSRELRLEQMATAHGLHSLIFPSVWGPFRHCTGRTGLSKEGSASLWQWLQTHPVTSDDWHADEDYLCEWHRAEQPPTLLAIDKPVKNPELAAYIADRLLQGPHFFVIKDRDDRPPPHA